MATKRNSRKSRTISRAVLGKPSGAIQARVQEVGPERFGIVAIDCAKARSKWMLCDFYGKILIPPTTVEHQRAALDEAVAQLKAAREKHDLKDHIVAVEMTGTYHRHTQRAFRKAGSETRLVHPFASKHFRKAGHADTKTDDNDLEGIFLATVNGFGLVEPEWDACYRELQIVARLRRDLVNKRAKLQSQIRQKLERCLPGYADLFTGDDLWTRPVAFSVARRVHRPEDIRAAGVRGVERWLAEDKVRAQERTVDRLVAWAANAAAPDPLSEQLARVWQTYYEDWQAKTKQIAQLEQQMAEFLVKTPYVLLLSHPGINVVSAAELAGEMGPIEFYAHAKAITGRAGLFPSRYQSDTVDRADGPLARFRNARLRFAWMHIADNLIKCNAHYHGKSELWKQRGVDARDIRVRIANRVTRTVFQMVSGRKLYHHPSRLDRSYVIAKLLEFHKEHGTAPLNILRDMRETAVQIPKSEHAAEAKPLQEICRKARRSRRAGPQAIGEILLVVLAKLGVGQLQSEMEASSPDVTVSGASTR